MDEIWERIGNGKYKLEIGGWNLQAERVDDPNDNCYKFQLYENMQRPQSASSLDVIIHGCTFSVKTQTNHSGALQNITEYVDTIDAFNFPGIPEPLRKNLIDALDSAKSHAQT